MLALLPLLACGFAAGIFLAEGAPWQPCAALFTVLFAAGTMLRRIPFSFLLVACCALGVWRGSSVPSLARQPRRSDSYPVAIEGRIVLPPVRRGPAPIWSFTVAWDDLSVAAIAPFRPPVAEGDLVRLYGSFSPLRYWRNPGDAARFRQNRARRRAGRITIKAWSQVVPAGCSPPLLGRVRQTLRSRIGALYPADLRGLALGIFLGDRRQIPLELKDDFRRAGTAHLLAISGLHVGLAAYAAYQVLLRFGGGRLTIHVAALLAGAVSAVLYAILSGFSPSAGRASLAVLLVTGILLVRRRPNPLGILAVVLFTLLLFNPELLWSISLQLSAGAVLGIVRLGIPDPAPALVRKLSNRSCVRVLVRRWIVLPMRISLAAFLGTLPVILYHFGACHPWAVATNIIACPLLALAISSGGLALVVSLVATHVAQLMVLPAVVALRTIIATNAVVASAPGNTILVRPFPAWIVVASLSLLLLPNRRGAAAGALAVLAIPWILPARPPAAGHGIVLDLDRGHAVFYRSPTTSLLITAGARERDVTRILRAMNVVDVDVAVVPPGTRVPIRAHEILSSPGTPYIAEDLELTISPGRGTPLSVEVRADGTRFVFGTPRADAALPLLIGRASPEEVVACEARCAILTGRPEAFLRFWPESMGVEVRFVKNEGALLFTPRSDGGYRIRPLYENEHTR